MKKIKNILVALLLLFYGSIIAQPTILKYRYMAQLYDHSTIDKPIIKETVIDLFSIVLYDNSFSIHSTTEVIGICTGIKYTNEYSKALKRTILMINDGHTYMFLDSERDYTYILFGGNNSKFLFYN